MLNRQKLLLYLLKLANRPVSRTELTKWCFLLRHESPTSGGPSFYDFVPYHYGPFSFALYQEAEKLVAANAIINHGETHWVLNPDSPRLASLGQEVEQDAKRLLARFGNKETGALVDYVYDRYPAYTVNSKLRKLSARIEAQPQVFTAGYEGLSIDSFLNLLVTSGVRQLIDVRNNPVARRYGFHRSTLQRLTSRLDINYLHIPELGIQSAQRQCLITQSDYDALFDNYAATTLSREQPKIRQVAGLIEEIPSVLVCMEAKPQCCHRSRLAGVVAKLTKLPVNHLLGPT